MKVLLLCSKGGHLQEMLSLRKAWGKYDYRFITFKNERLEGWDEPHTAIYAPWDSIPKFVWTGAKALIKTIFDKPDVLISTGMGYFDIFMFPMCKLIGVKTIYIESGANINDLTGTGNFVKIFADRFFVKWEKLAKKVNAEFGGGIF